MCYRMYSDGMNLSLICSDLDRQNLQTLIPSILSSSPPSRCLTSGRLDALSRMPVILVNPFSTTFWEKGQELESVDIQTWEQFLSHYYHMAITSFTPPSWRPCFLLLTLPCFIIVLQWFFLHYFALHYNFAVMYLFFFCCIYHCCMYTLWSSCEHGIPRRTLSKAMWMQFDIVKQNTGQIVRDWITSEFIVTWSLQ